MFDFLYFAETLKVYVILFVFNIKFFLILQIANVTYADMDIWDTSLVAPFLLFLNTYLPPLYVLPASTALLCGLVSCKYF